MNCHRHAPHGLVYQDMNKTHHFSAAQIYHTMIQFRKFLRIKHIAPDMNNTDPPLLQKQHYEALSDFRYQLRRFLHFSEQAVREEGLTPLQYQLLLHLRGFPGRDWASVGELAERLQMQHHGVVALLTRCENSALIRRQRSQNDNRQVEIHLLPAGAQILERLAALHRTELQSLQGTFQVANITEFNNHAGGRAIQEKQE
jgi:DNA-binding MarR family transcriptional regulator